MDGSIPVVMGCPSLPFLRQDGLTGSAWGDWAQYTDSPLRAFENELGVQVGQLEEMGPLCLLVSKPGCNKNLI